MRFERTFLAALLVGSASLAPGDGLSAAPAGQVSCIYETVAPEKLGEFGKAAIGEEAEAGLSPALNAAQNACIDQYDWSDAEAEHAEAYFMNRVARERLGDILRDGGVDTRKLDRAYAAVGVEPKAGARDDGAYQQALITAMQKEGFFTDNQQLLKAAIGYAILRKQQEVAQTAFVQGVLPTP